MSQTSQGENTADPVQDVVADFEVCARHAIECLLNRPTQLSKSFRIQAKFEAEPGIRCIIESGNESHLLVISLGLTESDLRTIFSDEEDEEMRLDAIGEMANILAGRLFRRPIFHSHFGCMCASVPSFAVPGHGVGNSRVVRGILSVGSANMILELAIDSKARGGIE